MPEDDQNKSSPSSKFRKLKGTVGFFTRIVLGIVPVVGTIYVTHIPEYLNVAIYKEQYLSLVLTLLLISTFLTVPATKKASREKLPWYDVVLVFLSILTGGYVVVLYGEIIPTLGYLMTHRIRRIPMITMGHPTSRLAASRTSMIIIAAKMILWVIR